MLIYEIQYADDELTVKLKLIFQALRIVKDNLKFNSKKVTTLPKVSNKAVLEYLAKNIELSLKNKVTTLEKLSIIEKEPLNEALSKNGARNGLLVDPIILQLQNTVSTVECEYCLYNLSKIAA